MTTLPEEAVKAAVSALAEKLQYFGNNADQVATEMSEIALTAALPFLSVQGAVNIDEIVQPLEDIHAPGGLCRWTDVATAIGEVRRALSALEPSTARELALEEAARKAQKAIAAILASGGLESDKWWDDLVSAQQSLAAAIRAISSPDHADAGKVEGDGWLPTHRHKKRGTHYSLIGIGKMQADNWQVSREGFDQSIDMEEVSIYRSVDDGSLWVRPREEFEDGRFETLPTNPSGGDRHGE